MQQPAKRPASPFFSSGPCARHPGWSVAHLKQAALGRSHRSALCKSKLQEVIERSRALLEMPDDWLLGIVPASDTGAVEMAMWSLLGSRPVDVLAWENFGNEWITDVVEQLHLKHVRAFAADYGELPDLGSVDFTHDVIFTWNGTASGVCVPDGDWIAADRQGLTICDATSAAFAMPLDWRKLDVVTWSWQKALGSEAAHGMLALGPRAVERLLSHTPPWPMPKVFRLTKGGKLIDNIFQGQTINTPSMLAVEDVLDSLGWAESVGGLAALIARSRESFGHLARWIEASDWAGFLAQRPESRSHTSVCIRFCDDWFAGLSPEMQQQTPDRMARLLAELGVAHDVNAYAAAPPGLRIWCGPTVEPSDVAALIPWLDWAYDAAKAEISQIAS